MSCLLSQFLYSWANKEKIIDHTNRENRNMTNKAESNTPEAYPFWDKETILATGVAAVAIGLYAIPILFWVSNTI